MRLAGGTGTLALGVAVSLALAGSTSPAGVNGPFSVAGSRSRLSLSSPALVGDGAGMGAATAARRSAICVTAGEVAAWSNRRLALETIAVPVEETSVSDVKSEVADGVGGLLLFGASAPANLGSELATLEGSVPGKLGLLVMTDEEGGGVQRMANLVGNLPWAATMGKTWAPSKIEAAARQVATKMAAAHVDMDLAPVVDVDGRNVPPGPSDPDGWRSFSGKTSVVVSDGLAFMTGMIAGGVIPVLKHFPGLGGVSQNTDDGPAHTLPWSTLEKVALPPYVEGIKDKAPAIMVSDATVPGLAEYPASLSPAAIGRELVKTLGFKGLILTDSLTAGAITDSAFPALRSLPAASAQAVFAGADMVLFGLGATPADTLSETNSIANAMVGAVATHRLSRSRLLAAATAVLAARHRVCPAAS
jgi:beta-N-acetylhexosaminidase